MSKTDKTQLFLTKFVTFLEASSLQKLPAICRVSIKIASFRRIGEHLTLNNRQLEAVHAIM
jgi:hypothetical protein